MGSLGDSDSYTSQISLDEDEIEKSFGDCGGGETEDEDFQDCGGGGGCSDDDINQCLEELEDCAKFHMENYRQLIELDLMNKLKPLTVRRLGTLSDRPWNPSDLLCAKCTSVVRFRVNRPISIISFGFFGPFKGQGKYNMEIELLTDCYRLISSNTQITPVIRENEIFHVKFENQVPILPCTWYIAKFSLMGPPTGQSCKMLSNVTVTNEFDTCRFKFEEPDSHQLPEISYAIRF